MKRTFTLSMIVLALVLSFSAINAQEFVSTDPMPRNAVLEEFTGIYCVFCPQGHQIADQLVDDNPERVVVINLHSSDSYSAPKSGSGHPDFRNSWAKIIASESGLTGYPAGQVNRQVFTGSEMTPGKPAMGRGSWTAATYNVLNDPNGSPVNVAVRNTYEASTKTVTVEVELYYTEATGENSLLNVVLLENGVIGWQTGGSENYEHNKILRDMLTGQWGEVITETTKGSYVKKTYEYTVPNEYVAVNCDIAAFVTTADHKYIYTGVKESVAMTYSAEVSTNEYFLKGSQETATQTTFTVTNPNDIELDFNLTVNSQNFPSGWTVELDNNVVTIPANSSVDVTATITLNSTVAYSSFTVVAEPVVGNEFRIEEGEVTIGILHEGAKRIVYYGLDSQIIPTLEAVLTNPTYGSITAAVPAGVGTFQAYPAADYDFIMFSSEGNTSQLLSTTANAEFTASLHAYIQSSLNNGNNVLITSDLALYYLKNSTPHADASYFFKSVLGINNTGEILSFVQNNSLYPFALKGFSDTDFEGMAIDGNKTYSQSTPYYQGNADVIRLTANSTSEKLMYFNDNTEYIAVIGHETETGGKIVYSTVNFDAMGANTTDKTQRNNVFATILEWFGAESAGEAIMTTNANGPKIEFGDTEVDKSSEFVFEVSNVGDADLTITGINITNDNDGVFSLESESTATIAPNGKQEFKLLFSPTASGSFTAKLEVLSNDANGSKATFNISGTAIVSSVRDGVAGNESIFTMEVSPNPIVEAGTVKYHVNGAANRNVTIKVMNSNGDVITTLVKGNVSSGTHTIDLNAFDFTSGNYFLIGTADGYTTQLPVVIVK